MRLQDSCLFGAVKQAALRKKELRLPNPINFLIVLNVCFPYMFILTV